MSANLTRRFEMNPKKNFCFISMFIIITTIAFIAPGAEKLALSNPTTVQEEKIPVISGKWNSSIGVIFQIKQREKRFYWQDPESGHQATGSIEGEELLATWIVRETSQSCTGRMTEFDSAGRPIKIEWSNKVIFYRVSSLKLLTPIKGWCCKDGDVFATTITECNKQGGKFFTKREHAEEVCAKEHQQEGWCCFESQVFPSRRDVCLEKGGQFFTIRTQAEEFCQKKFPESEQGYCCMEGEIFESSIDECLEKGGRFFPTMEEAEEHCGKEHPVEGWCCFEGKVYPATEAECFKRGGRYFNNRDAAEEFCHETWPEPEQGFCCLDGEVIPASVDECHESGGLFFRTREEAEEHCHTMKPKPEHGWCCRDGEILPAASEGCCHELGGRFFASREEAEEFCRREVPEPKEGFCCLEGRILPSGIDECQEQGGRFFWAHEEAERYCRSAMPDLIIQEMVVAPIRLRQGEEVAVRASIRNMGNGPARRVSILFMRRMDQKDHEMSHATIEHLDPGQAEDVTINSSAREPGDWLITAVIDPENRIREWDEGNNSATGVCLVEELIPAKKPAQTEQMASANREVQTLEQPLRGLPDPEIPRRSDKISDVVPELMAIKHNATYEFNPKEEKSFPFEITVPTIIVIKVFILEGQPEEFSILLNREGHDQQIWPRIGTQQRKPPGFISEMIEIRPEWVVQGKNWNLKLRNNAAQPLKAEISAGTIDLDRRMERDAREN